MSEKLAYIREVEVFDGCEIVFLSADDELWEDDRRAPEFDIYAEEGCVPKTAMIEQGWVFFCWNCEEPCEEEQIIDGDAIFCSPACEEQDWLERERKRRVKQEAQEAFTQKLPEAEILRGVIGGKSCKCFSSNDKNVFIEFAFKGNRVNNNTYCHGCGKIWVCRGDWEAWESMKSPVG